MNDDLDAEVKGAWARLHLYANSSGEADVYQENITFDRAKDIRTVLTHTGVLQLENKMLRTRVEGHEALVRESVERMDHIGSHPVAEREEPSIWFSTLIMILAIAFVCGCATLLRYARWGHL